MLGCPRSLWLAEGTVGCDGNVPLSAELHELALVKEGVTLDLVDGWLDDTSVQYVRYLETQS